jgi:universal stress protein E
MKPKRRIVAAIDFSDPSAHALKEAARLSNGDDGKLTVIHVIDSRVLEHFEERMPFDEGDMKAEIGKRLLSFIQTTLGSETGEYLLRVVRGHPFDEILRMLREDAADMLVMGAHGPEGEVHRVGSIAAKCVRKAPVDVMLVRERQHGKPFKKVLACVDFSENSRKAAVKAIEIALEDDAPIEFIHVYVPLPSRFPMADYIGGNFTLISDSDMMAAAKVQLHKFLAPLLAEAPGLRATENVKSRTSVAHGIVDYVNECGADLLVLGTRGRTGIKSLLLGTVAEKAIRLCNCSTLSIKPDGFHYSN